MTGLRRSPQPLRGLEVRCAGDGCTQSTADQAPSRTWTTAQAAVHAATALGWIPARLDADGPAVWLCPLHQAWSPAARRWVPAPHGRDLSALPETVSA